MVITVAMKAHRKLRKLPHYRSLLDAGNGSQPSSPRIKLAEGETAIGLYENRPDVDIASILITDRGLHVSGPSGWDFLDYDEIVSVDPAGGSKDADHLAIRLRGAPTFLLPVLGGEPERGTRDLFSLLMFLENVVEDRLRRPEPAASVNSDEGRVAG